MPPYAQFDNDRDLAIVQEEADREFRARHEKELIETRALQPLCFGDLEKLQIPQPEVLIENLLNAHESMIISARAGVGKTFLGLMIAKCLAEGWELFGRWAIPQKRRVLYIDGEMGIANMSQRMKDLNIMTSWFRMVPCDYPPDKKALNLFYKDDQFLVEHAIQEFKPDVVFFDNLSTLYKVEGTNQAESWTVMQDFIIRIRSQGPAVILIDHNGKIEGNGPRGTSAKSDIMFTVIELRRPADYTDDQGARFIMNFTKHRAFHGEAARPVEAWLKDGIWTVTTVSGSKKKLKEEKESEREKAARTKKTLFLQMFGNEKSPLAASMKWNDIHPESPISKRSAQRYFAERDGVPLEDAPIPAPLQEFLQRKEQEKVQEKVQEKAQAQAPQGPAQLEMDAMMSVLPKRDPKDYCEM